MKYVRYSFVALGLMVILTYAGNWVFAKEHIRSPFEFSAMAQGTILWGALIGGLIASTWKKRIIFSVLGGFGAWALLRGVYIYHLQVFPVA